MLVLHVAQLALQVVQVGAAALVALLIALLYVCVGTTETQMRKVGKKPRSNISAHRSVIWLQTSPS
jgi:hypothetical protein